MKGQTKSLDLTLTKHTLQSVSIKPEIKLHLGVIIILKVGVLDESSLRFNFTILYKCVTACIEQNIPRNNLFKQHTIL
jgi:hypothetical protein